MIKYTIQNIPTHGFCGMGSMFLTPPTVDELQHSSLSELVDMLSKHATEYSRMIKMEGVTSRTVAIENLILTIQAAIDAKRAIQKKSITN